MEAATIGSGSTTTAPVAKKDSDDALRGLEISQFLDLMLAELQNQDPLNPMENTEILQQVSQIREIESTNKLSKTLDAVLLGQSLSSASSLIGKEVRALADDKQFVTGRIDRVTVTDGVPKVHIGSQSFGLENIAEIKAA